MLKRIAIIGPESTGKSRLAKRLAEYYNTKVVDEYAREYFKDKEYSYTADNLVEIAVEQLKIENEIADTCTNLLFCDTDFIVIKIWSQIVFDFIPDRIARYVNEHRYELYLLCNTDVNWESDSLRNNSHNRQYIYKLFVKELEHNRLNYRVVEGVDEKRFKNAVIFVDELIMNVNHDIKEN